MTAASKVDKQAAALTTLRKARAFIKRGWFQGGMHTQRTVTRPNGALRTVHKYCALGALNAADGPGERLAEQTLKQAIRVMFGFKPTGRNQKAPDGRPIYGIIAFNDYSKTTKKEVLTAFDTAIKMIDVDQEAADNDDSK